MILKYCTLFVLVIPIFSTAQIKGFPDIADRIRFDENYTDTVAVNRLWDDGSPHITYTEENGQILRLEYHKFGGLKSECEIIHVLGRDTSVIEDIDTRVNEIAVSQSLIDLPNGRYVEYYESWHSQIVKREGLCKKGSKIGKWISYDPEGNKTICIFNDRGELGSYQEFYFSPQESTYSLKIEGQFGKRSFNIFYKKGGKLKYRITKTRKTGLWKY